MIIKRIIFISLLLLLISCNNDRVVFLVEQPSQKSLDNKLIKIELNNKLIYNDKLIYTDIASKFEEIVSNYSSDKNALKVNIMDTIFKYELSLKDRYVILSPYLKEGKIMIGALKRENKFNLE
ncbi:Probable lipoprotein precursor [Tenacibaculum maritimum]|uniref:hypothetical protein n=1 Tax=Tenacibaculum maritimum TaxID=107401 RepID=UPI0012E4D2F3|nr:hypothetical protein [Tenacibaculum maritimum]CAA0234103.1 Probable lipoprotein precursor [Tenacibaculum maritimum]